MISSKQVVNIEGINMLIDIMYLALMFQLVGLAGLCEETVKVKLVLNNQNYKEVQRLLIKHKMLGDIKKDVYEKFKSLVYTTLLQKTKQLSMSQISEIVSTGCFSGGVNCNILQEEG
jgi:hypothetical protein